jgi:hypothetical protein
MEAQSVYPEVRFFGTNYKFYEFSQADESELSMLQVAKHFNVEITCLHGRPILPRVFLTPSVTDPTFSMPFPSKYFDVIVSRDALNDGKITSKESHIYIKKFIDLLSVGGTAVLLAEYGADFIFPQLGESPFKIISVHNFLNTDNHISMVVYKSDSRYMKAHIPTSDIKNFGGSFFGIVLKRCDPNLTTLSSFGDCILDASTMKHVLEPGAWEVMRIAEVTRALAASAPRRERYAFDYVENLYSHIQQWEKDPAPFFLSQ